MSNYISNGEREMFASKSRVINRLHKLATARNGIGTSYGRKYRVEFLALAYKNDLVADITGYRLWDAGWEGLGERQFDACFEMGDSQYVIVDLVHQARTEGFLDKIEAQCGPEIFQRWLSIADRQMALF